jgi:2-polyprenyl-6-methoxyphenol hydroxylase-like FAD-dependent oxidoreductase
MKLIVVVGGGPSGLYFALLAKKRFPHTEVRVYEQRSAHDTYGFGIVLADRAMHRLRRADESSYEAIVSAAFSSRHRIIIHPDESIFIEGGGYGAAIARLRLLQILREACQNCGVCVMDTVRVERPEILRGADLIVGADGASSAVRQALSQHFGTSSWNLTNRLAWYGTTRHFPYPILSFKRAAEGHFVCAAYAYTERMSTFVAECDAATWVRSGLDRMSDLERQQLAEKIFADELNGQPLLSNGSTWRCLPVIRNRNWSIGNIVLIGDALHSAHPSIGSGTRIAMEDGIALVEALSEVYENNLDLPAVLALFRRRREPYKLKMIEAAEKSFTWYEGFARKVDELAPVDFAFDFLMRTGRLGRARLFSEYPDFMERYSCRLSADMHGASRHAMADAAGSG